MTLAIHEPHVESIDFDVILPSGRCEIDQWRIMESKDPRSELFRQLRAAGFPAHNVFGKAQGIGENFRYGKDPDIRMAMAACGARRIAFERLPDAHQTLVVTWK